MLSRGLKSRTWVYGAPIGSTSGQRPNGVHEGEPNGAPGFRLGELGVETMAPKASLQTLGTLPRFPGSGRGAFHRRSRRLGLADFLELRATLRRPTGAARLRAWELDMSDNGEIERLRKQAMALSHFGGHALRTHDLDALLQEAAKLVSEATGIELVKVLELLPDRDTMLVRAGVNWNPGVVGHATFGAHRDSPAGYALQENKPVISPDTDTEDRFEIPPLLTEHGVRSMVNVVIRGERAAWGVLEIDSRQRRDFNEDDISSCRTMPTFSPRRSSASRKRGNSRTPRTTAASFSASCSTASATCC